MKTISVFITHNQSYLKLVRQKQEERWRKRNIYKERKKEGDRERERERKRETWQFKALVMKIGIKGKLSTSKI